jgi:SagB-type dehydrogenase family enzyme
MMIGSFLKIAKQFSKNSPKHHIQEEIMTNPIGKEFMRLTRYEYLSPSPQSLGVPIPPLELPLPADARLVDLPSPQEVSLPSIDLRAVIEQRRSLRKYGQQPLSLAELSFLLWASQGVKTVTPRPATLRNVPSAGSRHAFETFLLVNRVEDLTPGLYRYAALEHKLMEVDLSGDVAERCVLACADQHMVARAAVSFFWVAIVERMVWRYVERGYRYLHLDAGHVCQNLYLAAEVIGCGACAMAAFDDDLLNKVVGADGETQFAIYAAALGKKPG